MYFGYVLFLQYSINASHFCNGFIGLHPSQSLPIWLGTKHAVAYPIKLHNQAHASPGYYLYLCTIEIQPANAL